MANISFRMGYYGAKGGQVTRDWESTLRQWSKPSSETEQEKCANAEAAIRRAISESNALSGVDIKVRSHGSYRNNTNVRQESDVDIYVCCYDVCFTDFSLAKGFTEQDVGLGPGAFTYATFKNSVEDALVAKFGRRQVTRGDRAFDVHENSYRVDADVVAAVEHRRYTHRELDGSFGYLSGIKFVSDKGHRVVNWPEQHYGNGAAKNTETGSRYKFVTRALKRLRYELENKGNKVAAKIPSFLVECLVWNVPNASFGHGTYYADMRAALAHLFNNTLTADGCSEWGEVSELKYLFRGSHPWTVVDAHAFLSVAWDYLGFE